MIAERLDTIIDRNSECPDCFDPETDACEYLDVCGAEPETDGSRGLSVQFFRRFSESPTQSRKWRQKVRLLCRHHPI